MDNLGNIVEAVQDDLSVGAESTLYGETRIKRAVNRAYRKAGGLFPWPELQDAKKTSAQANQEYYDYPKTWRSNSIWKLTVLDSDGNDERYGEKPDGSPLSFDDYLSWKEDYPDSTVKKWANQWRRYFLWPVPTVAGTNNIHIWGIENVATLAEDADETVFSYSTPEVNEAIVLETVAILKSQGDEEQSSEFRSREAKQILAVSWGKIRQEMAKYEKNMPFFDVPNFFGQTSTRDLRGLFDVS
jgi:hypothetical protein|tara:strand:+ start:2171 stop:2899 length:729 start_codon:yes stop_codon:yes gene_type:complete